MGKHRDDGRGLGSRHCHFNPHWSRCGAQYCPSARLYGLPWHHRDQPRITRNHCRDFAGGDFRLWAFGRVFNLVIRHDRVFIETVSRRYRSHGQGPGRGDQSIRCGVGTVDQLWRPTPSHATFGGPVHLPD